MKEQARQHIIDNYGENWLKTDWDTGDVIDIMVAFAKEKAEEFANKLDDEFIEGLIRDGTHLNELKDWWEQKEKE